MTQSAVQRPTTQTDDTVSSAASYDPDGHFLNCFQKVDLEINTYITDLQNISNIS